MLWTRPLRGRVLFLFLTLMGFRVFVLAFAIGCLLSSVYGFLAGAWPFGVVEIIWAGIALRRFQSRLRTERAAIPARLFDSERTFGQFRRNERSRRHAENAGPCAAHEQRRLLTPSVAVSEVSRRRDIGR